MLAQENYSSASMDSIVARVQARIEKQRSIPIEKHIVTQPRDCPFSHHSCDGCQNGEKNLYRYGDSIQKVYDVSQCYAQYRYKKLVEKSGLKGIQLAHTFEVAKMDKFNANLYSSLKKWDCKSGSGIYIAAKKDPNNPQGNGTGKTYAMNALTHKLCREGVSCLHVTTVQFFKEIKSTYHEDAKENEIRVLDKYINIPVLLWDDMGKESFNKNNDWAPEKIYHVVDERVTRRKPIVISSNFSIEELEKRFGEDNHGPAIISRLLEHCSGNYYFLGGPDRRIFKKG